MVRVYWRAVWVDASGEVRALCRWGSYSYAYDVAVARDAVLQRTPIHGEWVRA